MHRRRRRRRREGRRRSRRSGSEKSGTWPPCVLGSCTSERTKERSSADSSWPMSHTARILRGGPSAICRGVRLAVNQNTWLHASPGGVAHAVTVLGSGLEAGQGHRVHHAASPGFAPVLELTRLARLGLGEIRRGVRAGVGVVRSVLHDRTRGGGSAPRHSHLVVTDAEREVRPGGNVVLEFAARRRERRRAERREENRARGRPHRAFLVRGRAREVCATTPPGHKGESPSRTISKTWSEDPKRISTDRRDQTTRRWRTPGKDTFKFERGETDGFLCRTRSATRPAVAPEAQTRVRVPGVFETYPPRSPNPESPILSSRRARAASRPDSPPPAGRRVP